MVLFVLTQVQFDQLNKNRNNLDSTGSLISHSTVALKILKVLLPLL